MIPQDKHKIVCQQRRDREKKLRIESILDAARRVFFARGYLKATMDEIALEAEVTKPTIYQYFKAKDDLFFSLMLPLLDDIRSQLEEAERNLTAGIIHDGEGLIKALFRAFYHGYETSPETFRIVQLFQQQGLMGELKPEIRATLNDKGRVNFSLGRRLLTRGTELGLIKKVNVYELSDVIWGLTVGVIQLEDIKADDRKGHKLKKNTLHLAERLIIEALTGKAPSGQEKMNQNKVLKERGKT